MRDCFITTLQMVVPPSLTRWQSNLLLCVALVLFQSATSYGQEELLGNRANTARQSVLIELEIGVPATKLVGAVRDQIELPSEYSLQPKGNVFIGELGLAHQRYTQLINGIPLFGTSISVHSKGETVVSANGMFLPSDVRTNAINPTINEDEAIQFAKSFVGAQVFAWDDKTTEANLKLQKGDSSATYYPKPTLIYYQDSAQRVTNELGLAYQMQILAIAPWSDQTVIVDAVTGKILYNHSVIEHIDAPATGQTTYSGIQEFITFRPDTNSAYTLRDETRGSGITTGSGTVYVSNDSTFWDFGDSISNAILDVHWGLTKTYDYYLEKHNWGSFGNIHGVAHYDLMALGATSNAGAIRYNGVMGFGDGDGTYTGPWVSIPIVAHEYTHALVNLSADFASDYEPAALEESFCDIFGACVMHYAKPNEFSWESGDEITYNGLAIRSMSDPNSHNSPDTYFGEYYYLTYYEPYSHSNAGVQNYWFYLLVEGGEGINSNGDVYSVDGIGFDDAERIAYRSLTVYLNSSSNHHSARLYAIQSAKDLFGECSDQVKSVTNAWHAVGLGGRFENGVVASFLPDYYYGCSAPTSMSFTNLSANADQYHWNFGDGQTSTLFSPTHEFTSSGNYTVSLIVTGESDCNTSDTIVLQQSIHIDNNIPILPAACVPSATAEDGGIMKVVFGDISNESLAFNTGYEDFSCNYSTTVMEGVSYQMSVRLSYSHLNVWLDINNDGQFSSDEILYRTESSVGGGVYGTHHFNVLIPATAQTNIPLRMRVATNGHDSNGPINIDGDCSWISAGQIEDYSVVVVNNPNPPIADFSSDFATVVSGSTVNFEDFSLNAPTSWEWSFPGAEVTNSTDQDPNVTYLNDGQYDVELIVYNDNGSDTLLLEDYITVVTQDISVCDFDTTSAPSGVIYDPGGPNGDYGPNEDCSMIISPDCAYGITVVVESFRSTLGSSLRIYEVVEGGNSLLESFGYNDTITAGEPVTIYANTGTVLVTWYSSSSSVTEEGFQFSWNSHVSSNDMLETIIGASSTSPILGEVVNFSDFSNETPYAWHWDFGDGDSSNLQNPSHRFFTSGQQMVTLTATNCAGSNTDTLYIEVQQHGNLTTQPSVVDVTFPNCEDSIQTSVWVYNHTSSPIEVESTMNQLLDPFENGVYNQAIWDTIIGTSIAATCGASSGNEALIFNDSLVREAITHPFTLPSNGEIGFQFNYGDNSQGCFSLNSSEYLVIDYSTDGGATYQQLATIPNTGDYYQGFHDFVSEIPNDAIGMSTIYRIGEHGFDYVYDNQSIDDFYFGLNPSVASVFPSNAVIASFDSIELQLTVYRDDLFAGNYSTDLTLFTNDPMMPEFNLPINYSVVGESLLSAGEDTVVFNSVQQYTTVADTVMWLNSGCDTLFVDGLAFSNQSSPFNAGAINLQIPPGDTLVVLVEFSPVAVGLFEDTLTVHWNGSETEVIVQGNSLGAPIVGASVDELNLSLPECADSTFGSFWIYNTGEGPMEWFIAIHDDFENDLLRSDIWEYATGCLPASGCGSNSGFNALRFWYGSFRQARTRPMALETGQTIEFYLKYPQNSQLPCRRPLANRYASLEYSLNGNNWIVLNDYEGISDYADFVHIVETIPASAAGPTTQLRWSQSSTSSLYWDTWTIDDVALPSQSINLPTYPSLGTLAAGDSILITYVYYRDGLVQGHYQEDLWIHSNDSLNTQMVIPVDIQIDGNGIIEMDTTCLSFPLTPEDVTVVDSVLIRNTNCAPIELTDFETDQGEFLVNQPNTIITPYDSVWVSITYAPTLYGLHSGNLQFTANGMLFQHCLDGESFGQPRIQVSPDTLFVDGVDCPDSINTSFTIYNVGTGELTWDLNFSPNLQDGFESGGINTDLWESSVGQTGSTNCGVFAGAFAHRFGGSNNLGQRKIVSHPFPVGTVSRVRFHLKYGDQASGNYCAAPLSGRHVSLQYSLNGINWVTINEYDNISAYQDWTEIEEQFPLGAISDSTQFRIVQISSAGTNYDVWLLDNVEFISNSSEELVFLPTGGNVPIQDSVEVTLSLDIPSLGAGVHTTSVIITSNDTLQPYLELLIPIVVGGVAEITTNDTTCIDFGDVFVNGYATGSVLVENIGCAPTDSLSFTTTNSAFTVMIEVDSLSNGEETSVEITFSPTTLGIFNDTVTIHSNGGHLHFCVVGEGISAPEADIGLDTVFVDFGACADTVQIDVMIINNGEDSLWFSTEQTLVGEEISLETIRERWMVHHQEIESFVPAPHYFAGGDTGYFILDEATDFFNNAGNYLSTNFSDTIFYSDTAIVNDYAFGSTGRYFTSKVDNLFLICAEIQNVDTFTVIDTLAFGGSGWLSPDEWSISYEASEYGVFRKLAYDNSYDYRLTHLAITQESTSVGQYSSGLYSSRFHLYGLENNSLLVHMFMVHERYVNLNLEANLDTLSSLFVNYVLPNNPFLVNISSTAENLGIGDTSYISLTFINQQSITDTFEYGLILQTNDPTHSLVEIPIIIYDSNLPCANFSFQYVNGCMDDVQFIDYSNNTLGPWNWDFGDGNTSNQQHPVHSYNQTGTYTVNLIVGSGGDTSSVAYQVEVEVPEPATFSFSNPSSNGGSVQFTSTTSTATHWSWNFGDGATSIEESHTHTYSEFGTYIVTLVTTDEDGCENSASDTVVYLIDGIHDLNHSGVEIIPNPNNGVFTIKLDARSKSTNLSVYDCTLRVVAHMTVNFSGERNVDLGHLSNGVYYLKIEGEEFPSLMKLVVQN